MYIYMSTYYAGIGTHYKYNVLNIRNKSLFITFSIYIKFMLAST